MKLRSVFGIEPNLRTDPTCNRLTDHYIVCDAVQVALKKISKRYTNSSEFKTETDALLRIFDNGGHPNISGLRDMYEDYSYFYLILDLVSGGEMFEHLINYGAYSEADAARLMFEVASALAFLHGVGVVHADLKPENLLLCSKKRLDGTIKMIDFGCAIVSDDAAIDDEESSDEQQRKSAGSTGTTAYWPPERFEGGTQAKNAAAMDMWSVGVILYIMLTGVHPFDTQGTSTDEEIEEHIKSDPMPPLGPEFVEHLSPSAVDLITRLMEVNPDERMTAYEMLHHPWVKGETARSEKMMGSGEKLKRFKDLHNSLEAGIFSILVSHGHQNMTLSEISSALTEQESSSDESAHIMKRAFDVFDAEGKGFISSDDLGRVVSERTGAKVSSKDAQEYLDTQQGKDSTGSLSLSDFSGLFSKTQHTHFPRGHIIFRTGDTGDAMYFLSSGKVEVQTRKGQLVAILRSGDFFGEGSLLSEENKRFTTSKCLTPVDVIKISREDFDRYLKHSQSTRNELQLKWRARNLAYAKNLIRLQTNVKTRLMKKGEVVYEEGDWGKSMFRVSDQDGGKLRELCFCFNVLP